MTGPLCGALWLLMPCGAAAIGQKQPLVDSEMLGARPRIFASQVPLSAPARTKAELEKALKACRECETQQRPGTSPPWFGASGIG